MQLGRNGSEGDRRRGGNSKKTNLTKNQLVDNDDCVDDDKGYCIVACVSYSVGPLLVSRFMRADQSATSPRVIAKAITKPSKTGLGYIGLRGVVGDWETYSA